MHRPNSHTCKHTQVALGNTSPIFGQKRTAKSTPTQAKAGLPGVTPHYGDGEII